MKRFLLSMLLAFVLVLAVAPTVFAADGKPPVAGCPNGFNLHEIGMHEEHGHMHVGLAADLNGDGSICVRHIDGYHVHVDNVVR